MWWSTAVGRLEQAKQLDPVADAVSRGANAVLPAGPLRDALHGTWLGHQLHPLLVAVPIGLWTGASLLDVTTRGSGETRAAQRLVAFGCAAALPTAASGLADWASVGAFRRPKRVGLVHALANTTTLALYTSSWLARRRGDHRRGRVLALLGSAGLSVGGYLGGHLAYSQGVGVNRNADEQRKPRDWRDAAAAADVAPGSMRRVDVDGQQVLLARVDGTVHALGAVCSHYGGPLDEGRLDDGCVVCPWHGSRFRLEDGAVERGPATVPQLSYEVRERGERLEIRVRA